MKGLKSKASRFFRDGPSQDEKVAHAQANDELDFDAGIQPRSLAKKPSRFALRKAENLDKPLPAAPHAFSSTLGCHNEKSSEERIVNGKVRDVSSTRPSTPFPLASDDLTNESEVKKPGVDVPKVKPRPSLFGLRSKGSSFFRSNGSESQSQPPPPPPPQVSVDPAGYDSRPGTTTPPRPARKRYSSMSKGGERKISISRPVLLAQSVNLSNSGSRITVAFSKPAGPPPTRPPRPKSLEDDIIALMQGSCTRMVLPSRNRASDSTASSATPRSQTSSIESRLGLPSGHGTPSNNSLDLPLAARFPVEAVQPLLVRDKSGNITVSRFSEFIRPKHGGYAGDGVDEQDREVGPVEQYVESKEGDWTLEKRVSKGPNGNPGMLFRDRWGGFHFVVDV